MMVKALTHHIYWQNTNTISVECNIKFVKTFKDITIQPDLTQAILVPPHQSPQQPTTQQVPHATTQPMSQPTQPHHSQHASKLSQIVQQIAQGEFTTGAHANNDYPAEDDDGNVVATLIEEVENNPKSLAE